MRFCDVSFGAPEILDMVVMTRAEIIKNLLKRLKYHQNQLTQDTGSSSSTPSTAPAESEDVSETLHKGESLKLKGEFAVDQAVRLSKSQFEYKDGRRPN